MPNNFGGDQFDPDYFPAAWGNKTAPAKPEVIDKLHPGYELCDMHGRGSVVRDLQTELGDYNVQCVVTVACRSGSDLITGMIKQHRDDYWVYTNKALVVLEPPMSDAGSWVIKAGWSYDAHTLGLAVITIPKK